MVVLAANPTPGAWVDGAESARYIVDEVSRLGKRKAMDGGVNRKYSNNEHRIIRAAKLMHSGDKQQ
jgi:hypothetical protein